MCQSQGAGISYIGVMVGEAYVPGTLIAVIYSGINTFSEYRTFLILIFVSPCIFTIQQYLFQQMHNLIFIQSKLAHMFRPIRPSSGHQSLGIPRIQFCQNNIHTLIFYIAGGGTCNNSAFNIIYNIHTTHFTHGHIPHYF
jgi:hypothetical protein